MRVDQPTTSIENMDGSRIEAAMQEILQALHLDVAQDGLTDTPQRVARMYTEEVFSGLTQDPLEPLRTGFEEGYDEMVVARDIPFFSMCEHHFLPFYGVVHIGYIPQGRIVGISKLARVADILARRPQVQERLTAQIADTVVEGTAPMGAAVVVEAEHLCMVMRGIEKPGSRIVTSVNRGVFRTDPRTRAEFLGFTGNHR